MSRLDDLTGKKFNYLTVLKRAEDYVTPKGKHYTRWLCRCDCGVEKIQHPQNLKSGNIKSCGCMDPHRLQDLTGKRFGSFVVLEQVEPIVRNGRKFIAWKCRCDCGKEHVVTANNLRSGNISSCGCIVNSKAEKIVSEWLDKYGFKYETRVSFDGCLSDEGFKLNFDFYIPGLNLLIECDGIQHYKPIDFFGGYERFLNQTRHDYLKYKWALDNHFKYLVIDCRKKNLPFVKDILEKYFRELCL